MEKEIDNIIQSLEKLKVWAKSLRDEKKQQVLDKLEDTENNYFLIMKDDEDWKVYSMNCDNITEAFDKCENLLPDEEYNEHILINKDGLMDILKQLDNPIRKN